MRSFLLLGLVALAAGKVLPSFNGELIDGEYLVVMHYNVSDEIRGAHMNHPLLEGKKIKTTWNKVLKGYAVVCSHEIADKLSELAEVDYVEQNGIARALDMPAKACAEDPRPQHWGLARVSQATRPNWADGMLRRASSEGEGFDTYIIDTGILTTHSDFGDRASHAFDCTGEGPGDGNGHGTHCASTAGGNTHGVATKTTLKAVKVLGRSGGGTWDCVISGIEYVAQQTGPRLGSMSLGGRRNQATNDATDRAVEAGAVMISASGNNNGNACNFSPAGAPRSFTVNSMQNNDARSGFSNFGSCSHIFAPGTNILGAWIGSNTATRTISGTSMACPHVAGVWAETAAANPDLSNDEVRAMILRQSVNDQITNPGAGSPNVLVQTTCAE